MSFCNQYRITNYNSVEDGYYRFTGCTGIISVSSISPLDTQYVCADDLVKEDYSGPLSIVNMGLCPSNTPTPSITPTITPTVIVRYVFQLQVGDIIRPRVYQDLRAATAYDLVLGRNVFIIIELPSKNI